jgi:hypothetical protein
MITHTQRSHYQSVCRVTGTSRYLDWLVSSLVVSAHAHICVLLNLTPTQARVALCLAAQWSWQYKTTNNCQGSITRLSACPTVVLSSLHFCMWCEIWIYQLTFLDCWLLKVTQATVMNEKELLTTLLPVYINRTRHACKHIQLLSQQVACLAMWFQVYMLLGWALRHASLSRSMFISRHVIVFWW